MDILIEQGNFKMDPLLNWKLNAPYERGTFLLQRQLMHFRQYVYIHNIHYIHLNHISGHKMTIVEYTNGCQATR